MAYKTVDVDIYLEDFDDDELITELTARNYIVTEPSDNNTVMQLYESYTKKDTAKVDELLKELFNDQLGRIA